MRRWLDRESDSAREMRGMVIFDGGVGRQGLGREGFGRGSEGILRVSFNCGGLSSEVLNEITIIYI